MFWRPSPSALGRRRAELVGDALLGDPEVGHHHEARGAQGDPEPAGVGTLALDQRGRRLVADVRGEDEELDRHELLGARFGSRGRFTQCPQSPPRRRMSRTATVAKHRLLPILIALLSALAWPQVAAASHPQPAPDISQMQYTPIGKYGPADEQTLAAGETGSESIPPTNSPLDPTFGTYPSMTYNPSGEYVAYDTNLFETLTLPYRAAGDEASDDPAGNGGNVL
jgi:hypothetical protein